MLQPTPTQHDDDIHTPAAAEDEDEDDENDTDSTTTEEFSDYDPEGPEGLPSHDPHHIPSCPGIIDVLVTGSTDPRHGDAWSHYTYTGRVRLHDGLVGILRVPANATDTSGGTGAPGKVVFFGYVKDGRNFVGTWRICGSADVRRPGYEGAFCLGRRA